MIFKNRLILKLCKNSIVKNRNLLSVAVPIKTKAELASTSSAASSHNVAIKQVLTQSTVKAVNKFVKRTHTCGELNINNVGEKVRLFGWLQYQRMGKFLVLRDAYGLTQCIIPEERKDLWEHVQKLNYESVLCIIGTVVMRPEAQQNKQISTGEIEIDVENMEVVSSSSEKLPFNIRNFLKPTELTGMKHRYLFLRFPEMQANLRLRSTVIAKMREYLLNQCDFVEVETPTLFRRTPGGAHEFVVPTKFANKYYSLTQSPQQLKQFLMIGGMDRYFQVARCYRDETSKNDRQPEFTQMDIELSFVDSDGVMELIEGLIKHSWPSHLDVIQTPFPRLTYQDAMEQYGSDKPDLTIPYQIQNVTEILKDSNILLEKSGISLDDFQSYAIVFPEEQKYLTKSVQTKLSNTVKKNYGKAKLIQMRITEDSVIKKMNEIFSDEVSKRIREKLQLKENDVIFLSYGQKIDAQKLIGKIRVEFTNEMEQAKHYIRSKDFVFLWINDFPLFETDDDEKTLMSAHHPFTKPNPDDIEYLSTKPTQVRGLHYDLVLNGAEIAGGSIRINEHDLQQKVLQMLNIQSADLDYFLNAFKFGAPPHGGIAIGLDRYISILCRAESIRDVIAFPKSIDGNDIMSGAPANISELVKVTYHLNPEIKR